MKTKSRLQLAQLCKKSYTKSDFEERGIEVLIQGNAVCFRGTDEIWPDVLTDVRFIPWWTREIGWAPAGFIKTARRLVNKVTSELWHRGVKNSEVTMCGHSLGGTQALLVGSLMLRDEMPPARIVTFGSPRTGALKILRRSDVHVEMFKNGKDIVTTLPWGMPRHRANIIIGTPDSYLGDHSIDKYILALSKKKNAKAA